MVTRLEFVQEQTKKIDLEIERLGWSPYRVSKFLGQHLGKRSRWLLDDNELQTALALLKAEPTEQNDVV